MNNRRFNDAEKEAFIKAYPNKTNAALTQMFCVDKQHVEYLGKKWNLHKSDLFWRSSRQFGAQRSHEVRRMTKAMKKNL